MDINGNQWDFNGQTGIQKKASISTCCDDDDDDDDDDNDGDDDDDDDDDTLTHNYTLSHTITMKNGN